MQVALCLVLLSAGALVVRSFGQLLHAEPGFVAKDVLTFRISLNQVAYPNLAEVVSLQERLQHALRALPGVQSVGGSNALPMTAQVPTQTDVSMPGAPGNIGKAEIDNPIVDLMIASPGYFETLGIRLIAGRSFDVSVPSGAREVVIDRLLAHRYFQGANPIGRTLQFNTKDVLTIIGVVHHARMYHIHEDGRPQVYVRADDTMARGFFFAVRTSRSASSVLPDARAVVRRLDPQLALAQVRTMVEIVDDALRQQRISAVLVGGFACGALLLAAMGLFGVVSGSVTRRRQELAVRLALGATHGRIVRLVLGEGAQLVALGLLIGVPGIYFSGEALRDVLVGISPFDAPTLMLVAIGLAVVALVACYVPARRVATIEPKSMLKEG